MKAFLTITACAFLGACATQGTVQNPQVGGAQMYPSKTMMANLSASGDHSKLVAAVKTAGVVGDLAGKGPFTLFAPTDAAFDALADPSLLSDKARLQKVFDCSMVAGLTSVEQLQKLVVDHGGSYRLDTMGGCPLTATIGAKGDLLITSDSGIQARVTTPDVKQENGVVHVVDAVLIPTN
ncbi:fasciclin domain protein [Asticcacaulis biprosthecium C19]|uniref:Fasciclin domain protein n=1 Tax=Asticcacaulis biprosthecium C19 TaxID=715226 RepID=F4QPZ4_9CAUL|nr:fasciclin domain-containing protein [Asticcacaulis biprosthecium]EGF90281.1 fasciclin domain protein [Asticcacaulis biprosthecium C19]